MSESSDPNVLWVLHALDLHLSEGIHVSELPVSMTKINVLFSDPNRTSEKYADHVLQSLITIFPVKTVGKTHTRLSRPDQHP